MATQFDLLIKGGQVLDPGSGLDGQLDIGISGGRIAEIGPGLPAEQAQRVVEVRGANRRIVPGLIDLHTHVAYGATTPGLGIEAVPPDLIGVRAGVTTVVDGGSVGVANVGAFATHILPHAKTRVIVFLNVGSYAHTMPGRADVGSIEEIDRAAIAVAVEHNPGLIQGFKLRLVGPVMREQGEEMVRLSKAVSREHGLPLMTHIGNGQAERERMQEVTRAMLRAFEPGDILTHLCTPNAGGVLDAARQPIPELAEARANGATLDPALGRNNFGYEVARRQAELGLHPDTISSDLTGSGRAGIVNSLLECMAKFMAIGYRLEDVIRMTTANAARAIGRQNEIGAIAVGRAADLTILEAVSGRWRFTDTSADVFTGEQALVPVLTIRAGEVFEPEWGPHPWGWLPEQM
jgi:dihydroorotase